MKNYLFAFFIFIALIAGVLFFINSESPPEFTAVLWWLYAYFSLTTVAFHYGISKATVSRPQVFVRYYMASTTIKLMLNLCIIVVYAVLHRELAVRFIIAFMILYFLFTIFEVIFVWKTVRKKA